MDIRPVEKWKEEVKIVLESKRTEFETLGYQDISADSIWHCMIENVWKNDEPKRLYEVVQSIFQLQIHTYMDFLALESLHKQKTETDDELMASIHAVMQQEKQ